MTGKNKEILDEIARFYTTPGEGLKGHAHQLYRGFAMTRPIFP